MIGNKKQAIKFPQIGQIRKGLPKTERAPGRDLKDRFRVMFEPGVDNDASRERFIQAYRERGLEIIDGNIVVPELTVMFPFPAVEQVWESWYEAYTAGRMVARADESHFIRWIDTNNGEIKVNNGEPYTPFEPGMIVGAYTNRKTGKREHISAKASGRLTVVLPELARLAHHTVMTTSIYDVVKILEQLEALSFIMRFIPQANGLAGIPLTMRRRLTDVTWTQADGSAKRVKHGLIYIEAEPGWVEQMLRRMHEMALPAGDIGKVLLPAGDEVELDIRPEDQAQAAAEADAGDGYEDPDEFIDAEVTDVTGDEQPGDASTPPSTIVIDVPPSNGKNARPFAPDALRAQLVQAAQKYKAAGIKPKDKGEESVDITRSIVASNLNMCFAGEDGADDKRHTVVSYLFGAASLKALTHEQLIALKRWLNATADGGGEWQPDQYSVAEAHAVYNAGLQAEGQLNLL